MSHIGCALPHRLAAGPREKCKWCEFLGAFQTFVAAPADIAVSYIPFYPDRNEPSDIEKFDSQSESFPDESGPLAKMPK
jgi:hypothetical protein